jgi:hypothetical protein
MNTWYSSTYSYPALRPMKCELSPRAESMWEVSYMQDHMCALDVCKDHYQYTQSSSSIILESSCLSICRLRIFPSDPAYTAVYFPHCEDYCESYFGFVEIGQCKKTGGSCSHPGSPTVGRKRFTCKPNPPDNVVSAVHCNFSSFFILLLAYYDLQN